MDHHNHDHDHMAPAAAGGHDHHAMMMEAGAKQGHVHGGGDSDGMDGMECSMQMIVSCIY